MPRATSDLDLMSWRRCSTLHEGACTEGRRRRRRRGVGSLDDKQLTQLSVLTRYKLANYTTVHAKAYLSVLTRRSRYRTGLQVSTIYTVQGCAQTRLLRAGSGGQRESRARGSAEAASQLREAARGHRSAARGSVWRVSQVCGSAWQRSPVVA